MENYLDNAGALQLGKRPARCGTSEVNLRTKEIFQLNGDLRGSHIVSLTGKVWITQQGDMEDYILKPGERFDITRRGRVLVQSLEEAKFCWMRA